jgi:hypothetical protein
LSRASSIHSRMIVRLTFDVAMVISFPKIAAARHPQASCGLPPPPSATLQPAPKR